MTCDADDFRAAMRGLASGVSLVTTRGPDGLPHGMAATAVTSVSAEPPRILICVNKTASMHDPLLAAGRFAVNFLALEQGGLVRLFSSAEDRARRFADPVWRNGVTGAPVLDGTVATLECDVAQTFDAISHTMVLGDVVGARSAGGDAAPLVHFSGGLGGFATAA